MIPRELGAFYYSESCYLIPIYPVPIQLETGIFSGTIQKENNKTPSL